MRAKSRGAHARRWYRRATPDMSFTRMGSQPVERRPRADAAPTGVHLDLALDAYEYGFVDPLDLDDCADLLRKLHVRAPAA